MDPFALNMASNQTLVSAFESKSKKAIKEIFYDGSLYDVSKFLHIHPGGHEIMLKFTEPGEDATLAIQQFHSHSIDKVLKRMKSLPNRPQPITELSKEAEQIKQRNAALTTDFVNLYKELLEEKLFEPSFSHWIYRFVEWIALGLLGFSLITESSDLLSKLFGSFVLSMAMGRGAWIMHEFGHISGVGNPNLERLVQDVVMGISMGTSGLWWRRHHSLHHAMTNRLEADLDVDLLPGLFTYSLKTIKGRVTFFERNQMYFLPFYTVLIYFRWITWDTLPYLYEKKKIPELISIFCHYAIMYQIGFQMWLATVSLFSVYLLFNLLLNHTFVPVTDAPTHWVEQSFVNTVNVTPGRWVDWWMGYLNYQIEHHLFPSLPQYRSPLIVDRVKAFAQKHGLPYYVYSYELASRKALANLEQVTHFLQHIG